MSFHRALALLLVGGLACQKGVAPAQRKATEPFAKLVQTVRVIPLGDTSGDPVGYANAGLGIGRTIVISDARRADLKAFDLTHGRLTRVIGAPGDGEGQFRHPVAMAAIDETQFAVLDERRRRVSVRDTAGALIREIKLEPGFYTDLAILPNEPRIILAGSAQYKNAEGYGKDLHLYDLQGRPMGSYAATPEIDSPWESKFAAAFLTMRGSEVVEGAMNSNRLRVLDLSGRNEHWFSVADGWFRPLIWPAASAIKPGAGQQNVADAGMAWMHQQRLMNDVATLDSGRLLVRFQAWSPSSEPFFYYALVDRSGQTVGITQPTRAQVLDTHGDTVFWTVGAANPKQIGIGVLRVEQFN